MPIGNILSINDYVFLPLPIRQTVAVAQILVPVSLFTDDCSFLT